MKGGRHRQRGGRSLPATHLVALIAAPVLLAGGVSGTFATFTATTSNGSNSFSAGTVVIGDNDSGATMLALSTAKPGDSDTSCIRVTYTGSLPATVRLYGTTTGTGLDAYLTLTVTRGSGAGTFDNCTGFTADSTNYIGAGNGVVYNGTLQGFVDDYATAVSEPTNAAAETWTNGETHDYKFVVTLNVNDAAQGKTATQAFVWEARNT